MKPTREDLRVLAYFEAEDRQRRGAEVPGDLAKPASEAPRPAAMNNRTLFFGWLARVGEGQYALTLSGQEHLRNALRSEIQ